MIPPNPSPIQEYWQSVRLARRVVKDPANFLLRFPFSFLPARWALSDKAMQALNNALNAGYSVGGTIRKP